MSNETTEDKNRELILKIKELQDKTTQLEKDCSEAILIKNKQLNIAIRRLTESLEVMRGIQDKLKCDAQYSADCTSCDFEDFVRVTEDDLEEIKNAYNSSLPYKKSIP